MSCRRSPEARSIILDIRLPRIVTGILAGIQFALAGLLLQTITRNPLADPSLMGVSQGATLTVTLFLLFTVYLPNPDSYSVNELPIAWFPPAGMLGGMVAGTIIYILAFRLELNPLRITLCGIAVGADEVPIGVVTAFVGVPVMLALLRKTL